MSAEAEETVESVCAYCGIRILQVSLGEQSMWVHVPSEGPVYLLVQCSLVATPAAPRLSADIRADLIEFARIRIQDVWTDAGEVSPQTLAENIVAAQEFAWLSMHFPVSPRALDRVRALLDGAILQDGQDGTPDEAVMVRAVDVQAAIDGTVR